MTKEEFAQLFDGREYGEEMSRQDEHQLKECGMIAVFGASDDLVEFRGCLYDEASPGDVEFTKEGAFMDEECKDAIQLIQSKLDIVVPLNLNKIKADYGRNGWTFNTDIPHAKFKIVEGDELYGEGIVFAASDLK